MTQRIDETTPNLEASTQLGRRPALLGALGATLAAATGTLGSGSVAQALEAPSRTLRAPSRTRSYDTPGSGFVLADLDLAPLDGEVAGVLAGLTSATLLAAYAPRRGGLPFVVERGGRRVAFEVLRHDPEGPSPLATFGTHCLVVQRGGEGSTPSPETDARLANRIASELAAHESAFASLELVTLAARASAPRGVVLDVPDLTPR